MAYQFDASARGPLDGSQVLKLAAQRAGCDLSILGPSSLDHERRIEVLNASKKLVLLDTGTQKHYLEPGEKISIPWYRDFGLKNCTPMLEMIPLNSGV